jgi:hypothetical protein
LIRFTIWCVRLVIWLVVALVVMIGWCIAAATGHDRAGRSWARSAPVPAVLTGQATYRNPPGSLWYVGFWRPSFISANRLVRDRGALA